MGIKILNRFSIILICTFVYSINCTAQQSEENSLPSINIVPGGLAKSSFQIYADKNQMLKLESIKLIGEQNLLDQKCKNISSDSPENKKCQNDVAALLEKSNELALKINTYNTEIEDVVYNDTDMDKLSVITYFTLKKDQNLWNEFQKTIAYEKVNLYKEKIKIRQELTRINIKKHNTKESFNEGIILSMYAEQQIGKSLEDSLKSPFTGLTYKEMSTQREKDNDPGNIIVSFVMPKQTKDPMEIASRGGNYSTTEVFSLSRPTARTELNKLKDKKFNRLIAHSNGATLAECLLNDSLIEVKDFNIIGGEKSLLNGQALQQLLDNGTVKRIVIWIKIDDPDIWVTPLDEEDISERTQNFISYQSKHDLKETKKANSKIEYKWILGSGSLALLNAKDPQFISTYFREISKDMKTK